MTPQENPQQPVIVGSGSDLTLVGGGGHALVVAEAAVLAGWTIRGYLDDSEGAVLGTPPTAVAGRVGAKWLGRVGDVRVIEGRRWILAIGDVGTRGAMLRGPMRGLADGLAAMVIHPSAVVSRSAVVGDGVFVGAGVIVNAGAAVGDHAILNSGSIVEHECRVGANVHIAPGAVLGGRVRVGAGTLVGLGSRVLPNVTIGAGCVIGAGAVVVRDVGDGERVVGVPARVAGRSGV